MDQLFDTNVVCTSFDQEFGKFLISLCDDKLNNNYEELNQLNKLLGLLIHWYEAIETFGNVENVFNILKSVFEPSFSLDSNKDYIALLSLFQKTNSSSIHFTPSQIILSLASVIIHTPFTQQPEEILSEQALIDIMRQQLQDRSTEERRVKKLREENLSRHFIFIIPSYPHSRSWFDMRVNGKCICGEEYNTKHELEVWGHSATVDNVALLEKAKHNIRKNYPSSQYSISTRAGLVNKEYKRLGGTFTFGPGDTFIDGLHQRTKALIEEWKEKGIISSKNPCTQNGVADMLLRLGWDDRVHGAKEKLEKILTFLWEAYLDIGPSSSNTIISSLL